MKNLTKISVFFALIILFTGNAYAESIDEYFQQIDRDQAAINSCIAGLPKPASPSAWCQYYRSMDACHLDSYVVHRSGGEKIIESGNDCTIIPDDAYKGTHHYYYSGDQYCIETGIGTSYHSKKCELRTDITPIPKLAPAPGFQPLLEKSETQLEIERKAAENKIPPPPPPPPPPHLPPPPPPDFPLDGIPTILRDGKVVPFAPGFNIAPGDVVETGDGITAELISSGGAIYIRKGGTTVEFLGFRDNKVEPQSWPTAEDAKEEMISFLKNCSSSDYGACKGYLATVVMRGDVFFSEKMRDRFPDATLTAFNENLPHGIIATLTAIMKPVGTEYGVSVAPDGATTVTTLEGSVLVMDVKSKQSILVGANQSITIPKSTKGLTEAELQQSITQIDPNSIDKWWERSLFEKINSILDLTKGSPILDLTKNSTKIIILLVVLGYVALMIIKRKQIWSKKFATTPADKEENNKIANEKTEKKLKWFVKNSFWTGVFSTMISLYVTVAPQPSQFMLLVKNYWLIFLIITFVGFSFGLLGMKSSRKTLVTIGMIFNIFAIMLWLRIGLMI